VRAALITLALVAGSAQAEFMDGNMLLQRLGGTHGEQMMALGYVIGVSDALHHVVHCAPVNVTSGQMRDMVTNYLSNVPAERHLVANVLVARVLRSTWPCASRQQGGGTGV